LASLILRHLWLFQQEICECCFLLFHFEFMQILITLLIAQVKPFSTIFNLSGSLQVIILIELIKRFRISAVRYIKIDHPYFSGCCLSFYSLTFCRKVLQIVAYFQLPNKFNFFCRNRISLTMHCNAY